MNNGIETRTFVSRSTSRGCAEFGPSDLTYTDVVHSSGLVVTTVRGTCDGEYVDGRSEEDWGPLDLDRVEAARLSSGWVRL